MATACPLGLSDCHQIASKRATVAPRGLCPLDWDACDAVRVSKASASPLAKSTRQAIDGIIGSLADLDERLTALCGAPIAHRPHVALSRASPTLLMKGGLSGSATDIAARLRDTLDQLTDRIEIIEANSRRARAIAEFTVDTGHGAPVPRAKLNAAGIRI
jgi:hypothetical protein